MRDVMLAGIIENLNKIVFHYHPDDEKEPFKKQPYKSSNVLFVKNLTNVLLPDELKYPITSQA